MADLDTKTKVLGDLTVTLSKEKGTGAAAFDRLVAGLKFLGRAVTDPGYGISSDRPDQGLPDDQPGVDNTLPGKPARPSNELPGDQPEVGNELPGDQPEVGNDVRGARLGEFLQNNAEAIATAILKGTACDPATPKK